MNALYIIVNLQSCNKPQRPLKVTWFTFIFKIYLLFQIYSKLSQNDTILKHWLLMDNIFKIPNILCFVINSWGLTEVARPATCAQTWEVACAGNHIKLYYKLLYIANAYSWIKYPFWEKNVLNKGNFQSYFFLNLANHKIYLPPFVVELEHIWMLFSCFVIKPLKFISKYLS